MSSIPLLSRFLRKGPQSSTSQSSSDKPVVPPSSTSSYAAETITLPAVYRPTVSISKEAFPHYTQVSWPPNTKNIKLKPPSSPPTAAVQSVATPPALPPPTVTHSNAFAAPNVRAQPPVVPMHPESLIPARQINLSPPPPHHLIDIPIDSGPAFDDDIFRRKSDTNSSQNSNNPPNPKSLNQNPPRRTLEGHFSFPNKSPDHQAFTIPIGRHLSNGQYPPSPSTYSDSSSMYSYVSAPPELEYGYDDLHGVSSLRSYRLTRKDSTTLPQELIWHLFNGGPTTRENDDDRRSRHSSTGKRSTKARSRRNSDGGASIRTARRSAKPNSRTDTSDSGRSRSKSRSTKPKHSRTSSASVSSSFVSTAPPTPSTVVANSYRNSAFPSPREPMPAHALRAVQAAQAILGKETTIPILSVGSQSLDKPLGKPPAQREKRLPSSPGNADMGNIPHLNAPSAVDEPQIYPTSAEYLDSPSDEVTLASVLGGYNHPRVMKGNVLGGLDLPHVYAISPKQSLNNLSALSLRKETPLPQMPYSTSSPQSEVSTPQPPAKTSSSRSKAIQKQSQIQKSPPPNPVYPITHDDKLQSDPLYFETSNKLQNPSRLSTSSRPISGPSRPLPILPPAVPETPAAGPSKTINRLKVSSPRLSTADHKSWLTIDSDQTIKPINPRSFDEESSRDLTTTHFKHDTPPSASTLKQDRQGGSPAPAEPPILHAEQIQEPEEKIMQVDPESKRTLKFGSEEPLQVVTISSSSTVQEQQQQPEGELPPDMTSPPCTDTSPSSYSSAPLSSSNVTSIWSAEVKGVSRLEEGGGGGGDGSETIVRDQPSPDERQICGDGGALNSQELGWETLEDSSEEHGKHSMALETKDNNSEVPRTIEVNAVVSNGNVIPEDVSLPESNGIFEEKSDLQKDETPALVDQRHAEEDKKGNSPLTESINGSNSASNLKDPDINILTNEFRKSIHNSSHVSIPWNSSTGSIGSQPLRSVYVDHNSSLSTSSFPHDDAKSVRRKQAFNVSHAPQDVRMDDQNSINISPSRPEHYPLPPSMSSVELSMLSEEHKDANDLSRLADGRTSSPNEHRTRPFSPRESMRSSFSHKIEHKQNPSIGDVSLAASGFSISESHKVYSFANQRPASRTSSTFMNTAGPGNRSSALPIVEGVSSAPFPSQSKKAMLPIGNKIAIESAPVTLSRQRSGSEPHPNVFQFRSQGRLSTIHQSPIQYNRPSALPLRHERPLGSMTFPETPYEYTPMATPKANNSSPHVRGPSSTSNRQGKLSRLGSDVSLRRPAGPRPPRNVPNNPSNAKNNTSAKLTSPPNTARTFDLDPTSDGGTDFRPRLVEWRPYTLEAAQWTFTSEQLQEIVARAISQSSVPSTIRLLTLDTLEEIRPEIERLEILQQDVTIRYCANVTRRRVILKSLRHHLMDADWTKRSQLTQELNDTSFLADQLTKDLFHTMYRLQQLHRLIDVHNGSALAMAVRKLNSSFVKQLDDMSQLGQYLAQTEAEKEEAWATAERLEREVMELKDKLEVMSNGTPDGSESASRRDSARKPSVRASKASFRLSRSTRFSHASSTSSNYYPFSPAPPVPPIPRHAHAPNSRILSLNTDISAGMHSIQSAQSFAFSPTPEAFALEKAQRELYDILGLPRRLRKSIPSRTRPVSEILSPVTTSDGPLSPHKHAEVSLRRNNSIPISPYIISENIRSR